MMMPEADEKSQVDGKLNDDSRRHPLQNVMKKV